MAMEHWGNNNWQEKTKVLEEKPAPVPLGYHKFHMDDPEIESDPLR
jgi:hypothetical protein